MTKECPHCKQSLHPAMARRYSGYCSQLCEALVGWSQAEEEAALYLNKERKELKQKIRDLQDNVISEVVRRKKAEAKLERIIEYCKTDYSVDGGEVSYYVTEIAK